MDSKGLDVCNSLERLGDKECWCCCCLDGRKEACHGLDSHIVGWSTCLHQLSFVVTKPGEEAQTGPAEYLAALAIM